MIRLPGDAPRPARMRVASLNRSTLMGAVTPASAAAPTRSAAERRAEAGKATGAPTPSPARCEAAGCAPGYPARLGLARRLTTSWRKHACTAARGVRQCACQRGGGRTESGVGAPRLLRNRHAVRLADDRQDRHHLAELVHVPAGPELQVSQACRQVHTRGGAAGWPGGLRASGRWGAGGAGAGRRCTGPRAGPRRRPWARAAGCERTLQCRARGAPLAGRAPAGSGAGAALRRRGGRTGRPRGARPARRAGMRRSGAPRRPPSRRCWTGWSSCRRTRACLAPARPPACESRCCSQRWVRPRLRTRRTARAASAHLVHPDGAVALALPRYGRAQHLVRARRPAVHAQCTWWCADSPGRTSGFLRNCSADVSVPVRAFATW